MESNEILMSRVGGGGNTDGKTGEGFIDRSKVKILLCDNDMKSSEEVFNLLCKCSYQVISVRSPRQVIDALNAEGPDIDIILSEVDLPMTKGFKMLKHIMRDKDLRRIPVIMMSAQDEVALVVKCLRLGAADYLVKPLRTNELLNLWTHMWRRRRMLGLAEKNIMNCEFDRVPSDLSDANTNSTTLFSDDTDKDESNVIVHSGLVNTPLVNLLDDQSNVPEINEQLRGKITFSPKKSELKIGQSSAFLAYVKSNTFTNTIHTDTISINEHTPPLSNNKLSLDGQQVNNIAINLTNENSTKNVHVSENSTKYMHVSETQGHDSVSGYNPYFTYPYYISRPTNDVTMNMNCPPYYPFNVCMPPGMHAWHEYGNICNDNVNLRKVDRREAALIKFRRKRKERCFDNKIRYVNRKKLAEKRPRVKGQFVRKINGIDVVLNGQPMLNDDDEDDYDDDDEDDDDLCG